TAEFLALGVLEEESGEKARRECTDGLLAQTAGLGTALHHLTSKLKGLPFSAESRLELTASRKRRSVPGDGMSRRLRRVLTALKESAASNRQVTGEDTGPRLRVFLRTAFELTGPPKDPASKRDLAHEVLDLILQVVNSRYVLSLVADTYSPVVTMRDWFTDPE